MISGRDLKVLFWRLGIPLVDGEHEPPMTFSDIGDRLYITGGRVGQIYARTIHRLRKIIRQDGALERVPPVDLFDAQVTGVPVRRSNWGEWEEREREAPRDLDGTDPRLNVPIEHLEMSVRLTNCLRNADLLYVGQIIQQSMSDLYKRKNLGRKSMEELRGVLASIGLRLGTQVEGWAGPQKKEVVR